MEFKLFRDQLVSHINTMTTNSDVLFEVDLDKEELWNLYLDSFPEGTNEIYRERREYDCSACRHFIKSFGNVVTIKNGVITSIWDVEDPGSTTFYQVSRALSSFVKSHPITDRFVSHYAMIGCESNNELSENGNVHTWSHMYAKLPINHVTTSNRSVGDLKGEFRDIRNVFFRSLSEISMDAIDTVLELIKTDSLYRGREYFDQLRRLKDYKLEFDQLSLVDQRNYAWSNTKEAGIFVGKIRNHSIGVLLQDITNDVDLDTAVSRYEQIVAPTNYKRPKAIYTKRMIEDAQKQITELGLNESLKRRYATLDDITVNNVLFANRDAVSHMTSSVFDDMKEDLPVNPKEFSKCSGS